MLERRFDEIFAVSSWIGRPLSFARDFSQIYNRANLRHCLVAEAGGKVVAHGAGRPMPVRLGASEIVWGAYGNVMTVPEFRGHGIASRLNRAAWKALRRSGVSGLFISGGRGLYVRAGAAACGDYRAFYVRRRALLAAGGPAEGVSIRRARPGDDALLARIHRGEWAGFLRKPDEFGPPLRRGIANVFFAFPWVVLRGNTPVAYAIVTADDPARRRKPAPGTLWDYSGDRRALFGALAPLAKAMRLSALEIVSGGWDGAWLGLLRSTGTKEKYQGVPGTMLILDPFALFRSLRPWLESRLGRPDASRLSLKGSGRGGFTLCLGSESHKVRDTGGLARLLFGERPAEWRRRVPRTGRLGEAIRAAFPVPFPGIGLSWI